MFFWFAIICLIMILCFILFDYFLVKRWTKEMEESIDNIFDKLSKTTVVIFLLNLFGLNDENESKNNDNSNDNNGDNSFNT